MSHWHEEARRLIAGRPWLVALDVAQSSAAFAASLLQLGASDVLAIGSARGVGPLAELPEGRMLILDARGQGTMGGIRAAEAAFDHLSPQVKGTIDAWDPAAQALAVRAFFSGGKPVHGRRTWGARPESWQALEDKVIIDALWDRAGVPRLPCRVVPLSGAVEAARELDQGDGTVWAGDAREGFHGGATLTRWVRSEDEAQAALTLLSTQCDRVRVMPFMDGLPCSIHGFVVPDEEDILSLRPMEMLVLRGPQGFVYCGAAGVWRASSEDRTAMRGVVQRVGRHLRESVDYRGAFTIDGVMTREGFRPTELNPRYGAALKPFTSEDLPLLLLHFAMIEEEPIDWRAAELEEALLERGEQPRDVFCGMPLQQPFDQEHELHARFVGDDAEACEEGQAQARVVIGPSPGGSYLRFVLLQDHTTIGPPVSPRVAALARLASSRWDLGVGEVRPPPSLRQPSPRSRT